MRMSLLFSLISLATLSLSSASAALSDIEIKVTREKLGEEVDRKTSKAERVATKEILYKITIQSKTFKQLSNLEAKYMVFYYDSKPGSNYDPEEKSQSGSEKIIALASNRSVEFETKSITLTSVSLDGGWVYTTGASNKSKDRVSGVWVRVFGEDGTLVGEYANPSSITKRIWKD